MSKAKSNNEPKVNRNNNIKQISQQKHLPPGGRIDEDALHLIDSLTAPVDVDLGAAVLRRVYGRIHEVWMCFLHKLGSIDSCHHLRCASMPPICGGSWRAQFLMSQFDYLMVNRWLDDVRWWINVSKELIDICGLGRLWFWPIFWSDGDFLDIEQCSLDMFLIFPDQYDVRNTMAVSQNWGTTNTFFSPTINVYKLPIFDDFWVPQSYLI